MAFNFATNGFHGKQLVSMVNCDDKFYSVARALFEIIKAITYLKRKQR